MTPASPTLEKHDPQPQPVTVREFLPGDEIAFRQLNEEWIRLHFVLEPKDESSLSHPKATILDAGGRIFFAERDNQVVGCCALIYIAPHEFEVAKMAVSSACQGAGIGRILLASVIDAARAAGVTRLYLETNQKLTPALKLYGSFGFQHLPPHRVVPSPYARANVHMELYL